MEIAYKKETALTFTNAAEKTRKTLIENGFGIITEIDTQKIFREKLAVESEEYLILGACHAKTAYEVLKNNKDFGLLLPCNVTVYTQGQKTYVSTVLPLSLIALSGDASLTELGKEIEARLKVVIDAI